jgi:hypothetical protein
MKVVFSRKGARTRLLCRRADGTFTAADLGPSLPGHDFAHLIVERTLRLRSGFFVNIAKGYSIQQLSEAATIRSLGAEPYVAEILARALGSLATGACTVQQFPELVDTELGQMGLLVPGEVSAELAMRMLAELQSMVERFAGLAPGESLELQFGEAP